MQTILTDINGTHELSLEALLRGARTIFLTGEINSAMALDFARQMLLFSQDDPSAPVKVFLDSPGGEIDAGLVIYDILQSSPAPIELNCIGHAYSMAAILFASGRHGRYLLPHSKVMIHEPLISSSSGGICGSASSIAKTAESILETKRIMTELLAQDTGRTIEEIEKAISFDNFMNAEEAVAFGICDTIVDRV